MVRRLETALPAGRFSPLQSGDERLSSLFAEIEELSQRVAAIAACHLVLLRGSVNALEGTRGLGAGGDSLAVVFIDELLLLCAFEASHVHHLGKRFHGFGALGHCHKASPHAGVITAPFGRSVRKVTMMCCGGLVSVFSSASYDGT